MRRTNLPNLPNPMLATCHRAPHSSIDSRASFRGRCAGPIVILIAGADTGRLGARRRCMAASAGVRPPLRRLHPTQQVTMFSQSLRPPWATGTT